MSEKDVVNSPDHYKRIAEKLGVECIEVIEAMPHLSGNFCLGNAFKYLWRTGAKDKALQDVNKAAWYLCRHLLENDPAMLRKTLEYFLKEAHKRIPKEYNVHIVSSLGISTDEAASAAAKFSEAVRRAQ